MDDIEFFEQRLRLRTQLALRQFFYGPRILGASYDEVRQVFDACLRDFRAEYGNGVPLFPKAVANLTDAEILRCPGIGRKALREIRDALSAVESRDRDIGWEWNLMEAAS